MGRRQANDFRRALIRRQSILYSRAASTTRIRAGFYVGNWNSSVNWLKCNSVEMDFYGGHKFKAGAIELDFGALQYKEVFAKVTFKAAAGYTFFSSDIRSLGYKRYWDYNVGVGYDFGGGLSLTGSVQGATEQSAFNVVANPGIEINGVTFGQTTYSPNKTRFILTLTKTLWGLTAE